MNPMPSGERAEAFMRSSSAGVAPATAGAHIPGTGLMGPGFRRDDSRVGGIAGRGSKSSDGPHAQRRMALDSSLDAVPRRVAGLQRPWQHRFTMSNSEFTPRGAATIFRRIRY